MKKAAKTVAPPAPSFWLLLSCLFLGLGANCHQAQEMAAQSITSQEETAISAPFLIRSVGKDPRQVVTSFYIDKICKILYTSFVQIYLNCVCE